MGTVYRRNRVWWIKYFQNGRPIRESSKSSKKGDADRLLKLREGAIVTGTFHGLKVERTTLNELFDDLITEYEIRGHKSIDRAKLSVKHLKEFFGDQRACQLSSDSVQEYMLKRRVDGVKDTTINRELSALRRAYTIGSRHTPPKIPVTMIPYCPKLKESEPRAGFFEHRDYLSLKAELAPHLKPLLVAGYYTGMRRGELLGLTWDQVDLWGRRITLESGTTKNNEGRVVFLYGDLLQVMMKQKELRDSKFPEREHVFFNHQTGDPIGPEFREGWFAACKRAGIGRKLFHDLRRSAVRNLVRAGVSETVAMKLSGHKTRSIFARYNITSENDLQVACEKVAKLNQRNTEKCAQKIPDGHKLGTILEIKQGEK